MTVNYPRGSGRNVNAISAPDPQGGDAELILSSPPDEQARRRNLKLEFAEQCAYFGQVNARLDPAELSHGRLVALPRYPGADMIYAVPNENAAGKKVGSDRKLSGRRAGYPDINVDAPRLNPNGGMYHGLRIEMKKAAGVPSDVEPLQADWHERLRDQGYRVCVCFGWREAWAVTKDYLGWEDY